MLLVIIVDIQDTISQTGKMLEDARVLYAVNYDDSFLYALTILSRARATTTYGVANMNLDLKTKYRENLKGRMKHPVATRRLVRICISMGLI